MARIVLSLLLIYACALCAVAAEPIDVQRYFDQLEEQDRHNVVAQLVHYPRTAHLGGDKVIASCQYTCEESGQCNFEAAYTCINENVELKAFVSQQLLVKLVEDFDTYQQDHLVRLLDGFQISRVGIGLLCLKRAGSTDTGRTAFIDYHDLRDQALASHSRHDILDGVFSASLRWFTPSVLVSATASGLVSLVVFSRGHSARV